MSNLVGAVAERIAIDRASAQRRYAELIGNDNRNDAGELAELAKALGKSIEQMRADQAARQTVDRLRGEIVGTGGIERLRQESVRIADETLAEMRALLVREVNKLDAQQLQLLVMLPAFTIDVDRAYAALAQRATDAAVAITTARRGDDERAERIRQLAREYPDAF
jgi:hypothetical protein